MVKLSDVHKAQICAWIGCHIDLSLLYQATVHGCSSQDFHSHCDNQDATITVCYNTTGYIFGGFTSKSWTSDRGVYTRDEHAFLYRLETQNGLDPKLYRVRPGQENQAIINNITLGPMFGKDFCPFQQVQQQAGFLLAVNNTCVNKGGILKLGKVYDMGNDNCHTFCGNNISCTEIEVYSVRPAKTSTAWRKISSWNRETLTSSIETYCPPPDSKVKAINLLLLGPVGAGKSSFFNSVNSIFQGEITAIARSGSADRSLTRMYRRYRVTSRRTGKEIKLRLCDTRGIETEGGLDLVDIMAVVQGHVPDRFKFQSSESITAESTGYNSSPSADDRIHCVGLVIDSTSVDVLPQQYLHLIKSLQNRLNREGIPQVVILTKTDKACPDVKTDASKMFSSGTVCDLVDQAGQLLGLPRHCVFPVKNYEDEMEVEEGVDVPILLCLKHVLRFSDDFLRDSLSSE